MSGFFKKISLSIVCRINKYIVVTLRKTFNTIYYKVLGPNSFVIVNCSFKQWGGNFIPFNVGDDINFIIFKALTGKRVINYKEFFHKKRINVMGCGSIIEWMSNRYSIIWGSGIMNESIHISQENRPHKVTAVRGRLTKRVLQNNNISCPDVFGDPALLLPLIFHPLVERTNYIGVIPHYVDLDSPIVQHLLETKPEFKLIDIQHYKKWQDVIIEICACKFLISSSLHGLILADAYAIPNIWVKFSDKIVGGDFKFKDYFSSVNRDSKCYDLRDGLESFVSTMDTIIGEYKHIVFSANELLNAFPNNETCQF